jgi:hypothetical protein
MTTQSWEPLRFFLPRFESNIVWPKLKDVLLSQPLLSDSTGIHTTPWLGGMIYSDPIESISESKKHQKIHWKNEGF